MEELARLKLDQPLEPRLHDALLTELEESHCGMMPKTAFGKWLSPNDTATRIWRTRC